MTVKRTVLVLASVACLICIGIPRAQASIHVGTYLQAILDHIRGTQTAPLVPHTSTKPADSRLPANNTTHAPVR